MITLVQSHSLMDCVYDKPIETGIGSPDTWYSGMIKPVATGVNELPQSRIPSLIFLVVGYHKPFLFDVSGLTPHAHLSATLSYFEDEGRLYRGLRMGNQKWWALGHMNGMSVV